MEQVLTRGQRQYRKHKEKMLKDSAISAPFYKARGKAYIQNYLKTHPCVDCGESNIIVLEFDHVRGEKKSSLYAMHNRSLKSIQEEVDKCEVRCVNCHRIATYNRATRANTRPLHKQNSRKYVEDYLSKKCCIDCKKNNPLTLEFDHVKGEKKHLISKMKKDGYSIERIQQEINKCEIRCGNCHRIVTDTRIKEGTHKDRVLKTNDL